MKNFWQKLNNPFFCLAPMEEVTDVAFREMFARYSNASNELTANSYKLKANEFVMFTEFVNVDGLTHPEGYKKLSIDLKYTEAQRPIVAQLWGTNPEKFFEAGKIVKDLGFDGIDINMGCPQEKEVNIGACAALINTPKLALEIIKATQESWRFTPSLFKEGEGGVPVSVKTRIGYHKIQTEEWIGTLLQSGISALTIHGRTKKEMSKVPAHWEEIKKAVELRNKMQNELGKEHQTLIIGNGDVLSRAEGLEKIQQTGCDGIMIGRGAFGSPWIFRNDNYQPSVSEKLRVMLEHAELFEKWLPEKHFLIMRKHFKAYASGFENSAELRAKLMATKNPGETREIVNEYLKES